MRKMVLFLLGIITALITVELILRFIVLYPPQPVRKPIYFFPKGHSYHKVYMYEPNSKYLNIEAGYKRFWRNNVGIHGPEVNLADNTKLVFLAGSSYIEAYQVPIRKTAAAVFNRKLQEYNPQYSVFNLGASGHDPYMAYFRVKLFTQKYRKPDKVVLALEHLRTKWLSRHEQPLSFDLPDHFGENFPFSKARLIVEAICSRSSLASLCYNYAKRFKGNVVDDNTDNVGSEDDSEQVSVLPEGLKATLLQFQKDYGHDFMLVFFSQNELENKLLRDFCNTEGILFFNSAEISGSENRLKGVGHLNESGNYKLGEFIYESFIQAYPKQ